MGVYLKPRNREIIGKNYRTSIGDWQRKWNFNIEISKRAVCMATNSFLNPMYCPVGGGGLPKKKETDETIYLSTIYHQHFPWNSAGPAPMHRVWWAFRRFIPIHSNQRLNMCDATRTSHLYTWGHLFFDTPQTQFCFRWWLFFLPYSCIGPAVFFFSSAQKTFN